MAENWMPGPWAIVAEPGEFNQSYWIGPVNPPDELWKMSIAEVRNGAGDKEYGGRETEHANARLIAAAPELYEALKIALPYVERFAGEEWAPEDKAEQCRAALAKARGEK